MYYIFECWFGIFVGVFDVVQVFLGDVVGDVVIVEVGGFELFQGWVGVGDGVFQGFYILVYQGIGGDFVVDFFVVVVEGDQFVMGWYVDVVYVGEFYWWCG